MRFRRRSSEVEAMRFEAGPGGLDALKKFCGASLGWVIKTSSGGVEAELCTLENTRMVVRHVASEGDWIIKEADGSLHPCSPGVFEKLYEPS